MADPDRHLARVFNEVPELYDRVRPGYPDELFADLVTFTGMDEGSSVLEVGCGTGQATRSLAARACSVTAVEPRAEMAALARRCTGGSIATFVSPCSTPLPSASARGWATEHHAAT